MIDFDGYKLNKKRKIAVDAIANLHFGQLRKKHILDSRNNSKNGLTIAVWDALEQADLVKKRAGNNFSQTLTAYRASKRLKRLFEQFDPNKPLLDYNLHRNTERKKPTRHACVVIQTGKRDILTGKKRPRHEQKKPLAFNYPSGVMNNLRQVEDRIESFNHNQRQHSYETQINPCVKMVHSEQLGRYVMLHSWSILSFQSFSKQERKRIIIDGEPTQELDFSGYFLRQYYHFRGIDPTRDDLYQPEKIIRCYPNFKKKYKKLIRDFVKKATILCLNTNSPSKAAFAIKNEFLRPTEKELTRKETCAETRNKIIQKRIRSKILYDIENASLQEIINRITTLHKPIEDDFFKPELYALTMSLSAGVLLDILDEFTKREKPVLPIHDSIIVKVSDSDFARLIMIEKYAKFHRGFNPVIKP
ncbi:MAG: hypothetical protein C0397_19515 [Odoribacter sp.]|nr:hypothetical protein [Odoribacter sp.]